MSESEHRRGKTAIQAISGELAMAHTECVTLTVDAWSDEVREAAIAGDGNALKRLFDAAKELYGEDAGAKWAEAVSALDASAQTG